MLRNHQQNLSTIHRHCFNLVQFGYCSFFWPLLRSNPAWNVISNGRWFCITFTKSHEYHNVWLYMLMLIIWAMDHSSLLHGISNQLSRKYFVMSFSSFNTNLVTHLAILYSHYHKYTCSGGWTTTTRVLTLWINQNSMYIIVFGTHCFFFRQYFDATCAPIDLEWYIYAICWINWLELTIQTAGR